jgi:predicted ATPase
MSTMTFYIDDAAAQIAELIEREESKLTRAKAKQEEHSRQKTQGSDAERRRHSTKFSAAKRDQHRAETMLLAYKEALRIVLLERQCRQTGEAQPWSDPEEYLMIRRRNPPLV